MSVTRNEMKNEALARMRILKIRENAVNDLKNYDPRYGYSIMAYVYNLTNDTFSEFESVCVKPNNGGLIRTA